MTSRTLSSFAVTASSSSEQKDSTLASTVPAPVVVTSLPSAAPAETKVTSFVDVSTKVSDKKVIVLFTTALDEDAIRVIHKLLNAKEFNPSFHVEKTLEAMLKECDVLFMKIDDPTTKSYFNKYRNWLDANKALITVIYKHATGKKIANMAKIKATYLADFVVKYLPTEVTDKIQYLTTLFNDHISSKDLESGFLGCLACSAKDA